ncbi:hypothetical protein GOP47_0004935 [Adiantum capillus-veneris]|uniref:Elongator complex protein 5 n=1 Tax=Adiantum capillus-veneris TaxID=13818 RepID=A0A9D4V482_ADICA|nr:hypothetical protein GOP47_0004935 [Adiantum capillus-veneris]
MVESVSRSVREGVLPGEFAPALMLHNRSSSPHSARALLLHLLASLSSSVAAGTAQPGCIVMVAADRGPEFYRSFQAFKEEQLLRFHFVDCFVDPLGWRKLLSNHQLLEDVNENSPYYPVCHDLRNLDALLSHILQSGMSGKSEALRFSVVIDSVSSLLAHNSADSVAKFLNNLRSNGKVSSLIWMLHSDLHDAKTIKSLEYISSMNIFMEQLGTAVIRKTDGSHTASNKLFSEGMLKVRQKRRNGRVRERIEKFEVDGLSISISNKTEGVEAGKVSIPQVQFRLQLSDKERQERAKVVLPFEHQGNGQESFIYNGRLDAMATPQGLDMAKNELQKLTLEEKKSGQVEYLRDSDDERPDSDEDPDDDLDI